MTFRNITNRTSPCIVCTANTTSSCRNCSAFHCPAHLVDTSCVGCASQLWTRETRVLNRVKLATMGVAVALLGVAITLQLPATLVMLAFAAYFGVSAVVTGIGRVIVKRKSAKLRFAPSSKPLVFAANSEANAPSASKKKESEYSIRRRRNKKKVRRRSPRAVFMTRGGYFYQ